MSEFEAYRGLFVAESRENHENLVKNLLLLELGSYQEAIDEIFRSIHTLKGASASMGFSPMEHLCHTMEDVFSLIRSGAADISPELVNLLLACSDLIEQMLDDIESGGDSSSKNPDTEVNALRQWIEQRGVTPKEKEEILEIPTQEEQPPELPHIVEGGNRQEYEMQIIVAGECTMKDVRAMLALGNLNALGKMKILKFGGSSISSPERIKKVEEIIRHSLTEENRMAVVVSAFGDVTDDLIQMSALAATGDSSYLSQLKKLEDKHIDVIRTRIAISTQSHVLAGIKVMLNELDDVLHGVLLVKELTPKTQDFILSFGERLSAFIMAEIISQNTVHAEYLDARLLIKTDDNFGAAKVHYDPTYKNIVEHFNAQASLQVATGFIGSTLNDETTTLGRGGSDYTASLLGAALRAKEIQIWTDVDGVLRADPKKIPNASPIASMTYEEAMEMSYFGAKVIYPPTIQPGLERKIPIRIKNTLNPDFEGTLICEEQIANHYLIKGISSIENISLLRIQGSGMIGVTGIAARLFNALAREKINIILITQASSEHSICFAVELPFAIAAKKALEKEFALEMRAHYVDEIIVENDLSIIAIIGENMRKTPGISARLFQALGQKGINVIAIAQGSSELNISLAVDKKEETRALNAIYETFYPAADEK